MRDPNITHKIMSAIKSKNTRPEMILRRTLWKNNYRYRVNYKSIPGKPDIVFTKYKVAIFCDGDFWHGHNWALRGKKSLDEELSSYSNFWKNKILRNVERDRNVDQKLRQMGWIVVRIWESDIKKDPEECVKFVEEAIFESKIRDAELNVSSEGLEFEENEYTQESL